MRNAVLSCVAVDPTRSLFQNALGWERVRIVGPSPSAVDPPQSFCQTVAVEVQAKYFIRLSSGQQFGPAPLEMIFQWAREGRIPVDALLVPAEGRPVQSVLTEPTLRGILQQAPIGVSIITPGAAPEMPPSGAGGAAFGIATGVEADGASSAVPGSEPLAVIIPYKNPPALIGYYIGIVSWIPLVGLIAGPTAIVLGIIGLKRRKRQPQVRGMAHAWIAIIMGLISTGCVISIIAGAMNANRHPYY